MKKLERPSDLTMASSVVLFFKSFTIVLCFFLSSLALSLPLASAALAEEASREYLDKVHAQIKEHHYQEAMRLLKMKAEKGCSYSQSLLGLMYQKGLGCKADLKEAAHYFGMAAKNDFVDAELQLGKLYRSAARELSPGANEAKYWLTKAADKGVTEARDLINHVPGGPQIEYKVAQLKTQAASGAGQSEQGITQAWTGYANIVNTLNGASSSKSGTN